MTDPARIYELLAYYLMLPLIVLKYNSKVVIK